MGRKTVILLWLMLCLAATVVADNKQFTLVIDAGHGGHDAGALGKFSKEKNINLNVALAFGRYVENNCPDVKVIYTRKKDVFIPLHERANIANRNKADLFVSIHTNALPKGRVARGLETYTLGMNRASDNFDVAARENSVILIEKDYKQRYEGFDPRSSESYIMFEFMQDKNMAQSVELAKVVQRRTCASAGRQNKGVKQAGFLVLRETSMPSCLIELGFITTPDEETYLNSSAGIDALGKGIYQAFTDYRSKFDKKVTVPYKAETSRKINIPSVVPQEVPEQKAVNKRDKRKGNGEAAAPVAVTDSKSIMAELADARNGRVKDTSASDASTGRGGVEPQQDGRKTEPVPVAEKKPAAVGKPDSAAVKPAADNAPSRKTDVPVPAAGGAEPEAVPVFKVQIMASSRHLGSNAAVFKGLNNVGSYEEGGLYKFTYGSSVDYNEISALRKSILDKFPEAFVVAFKDGRKMNVAEAIREFKSNRNKR